MFPSKSSAQYHSCQLLGHKLSMSLSGERYKHFWYREEVGEELCVGRDSLGIEEFDSRNMSASFIILIQHLFRYLWRRIGNSSCENFPQITNCKVLHRSFWYEITILYTYRFETCTWCTLIRRLVLYLMEQSILDHTKVTYDSHNLVTYLGTISVHLKGDNLYQHHKSFEWYFILPTQEKWKANWSSTGLQIRKQRGCILLVNQANVLIQYLSIIQV